MNKFIKSVLNKILMNIHMYIRGIFIMEITNENVFEINYNSELNRLEVGKKNKFLNIIKRHKIVSLMFIILIMFSCLNFFLIYSFINVLQSI